MNQPNGKPYNRYYSTPGFGQRIVHSPRPPKRAGSINWGWLIVGLIILGAMQGHH